MQSLGGGEDGALDPENDDPGSTKYSGCCNSPGSDSEVALCLGNMEPLDKASKRVGRVPGGDEKQVQMDGRPKGDTTQDCRSGAGRRKDGRVTQWKTGRKEQGF